MTFVARETQMARLSQFLEAALSARGQMAFLSSEAGWGKTSLLANFSRHAQDAHPHLVVASGICSTYKGAGDPYLPFREILRMLCGDVEAKWAAGAISRQDALRLWALLPTSAHALVSQGRNLIDTFVPYLAFLDHAQAHAGMAPELVQQIRALRQIPHNSGVNQERILEEYLEVLMEISRKAPLLLILDDLHWADSASINLLYHLGRRLRDSAVMILGAYRPEDVHLGRDGKAHPLAPVLHEFKGLFGNIWLHLDQGGIEEGRQFVDALLERTPNQLDDHFRELLTRNTRGRPLFIAEMLLEMQERGDLQQDEAGRWVNRAQITWDALPERVEGVIESRVNRLDPHLREALTCASVEGEEFTAQVIGRVLGVDDETMVRRLSMELAREHKLIQARGVLQHGEQRISRYQFSHILFQKYIYSTLDAVERVHLHAAVGDALECLYQGQKDEIAGLLAWHYQQAGAFSQAIAYSKQAGETAARIYAMTDAIAHFQQAIRLAEKIGLSGEPLSELYIRLGRYQELDSAFNQALRTYEQLAHLALQQRNPRMELASLMARITILSAPTAVHDPGEARLLGERALFLASELNDPAAEARILWSLSIANFFLYHLQEAIIFGERSLALARQHNLVEQTAQTLNDIGGMVYLYSGRLSQARHALQEASDLWRQLGNMAMLTDSLGGLCITHVYTGNFEQAIAISRQAYQLSVESKNLWGQSYSLWTIGDAYAERGEFSLAIESMQECIRLGKQAGFLVSQSYTPIKLAQIYLELGNWDQAISLAEAAVNFSEAQVPAHAALGRSVLARLQIHSGKLSEASANIQAAKRDPYRDSWLVFFLFVPLAEAELAIAQGMPSNALAILDELIRRLQNYDMRLLLPEALYLSGQALLGSGQEQFAQARFVEALAAAEATGSRRCVWRSMCALSRLEAHADQASTWLHKAGAVLDWILALFSEQHAYLRESFIAQADVKRVMAGRDGSK